MAVYNNYSLVSSTNSSQTDKALPAKTPKPNFVTFFVYFSKPGSRFARNLPEFGIELSEEL